MYVGRLGSCVCRKEVGDVYAVMVTRVSDDDVDLVTMIML